MNKILSTGRTVLKLISAKDFEDIYLWLTDFDYNMLWSNIREFPSKKHFFELLEFNIENEFSFYFMIQNNLEENIGTIFIHDHNKTDNYASISAFLLPKYQNSFFGVDAYKLVFDFVHQNLPIRKLYLDVFEYNIKSIKLIEKVGFDLEGIFKKHRYYKGDYHNVRRYSFFLNEWSDLKKRFE